MKSQQARQASPPPQLPTQGVSKKKPSFQFPKVVINPLLAVYQQGVDRGWYGVNRLEQHVVMCGFPRSGTTLCQLMVEACVDDVQVFGKERRGLEMARVGSRQHRFMLTKRPSDIFCIPDLIDFYATRSTQVKFVLFLRDPRGVLTSQHKDRPGEYYVSVERWRAIFDYWQWARTLEQVLTLTYEDLIAAPQQVETQLTNFIGWEPQRPFETFHQHVPKGFDTDALNGVRKLDVGNAARWREPRYRDRIVSLLTEALPELPECLIDLGYEADTRWVAEYLSDGQSLSRAA